MRGVEKRPKGRNSGKRGLFAVLERQLTACGKPGSLSTFIHRRGRSRGGLSEKGPSRALPESTCEKRINASSQGHSRPQGSDKPPHMLIFLGFIRPRTHASFGESHGYSLGFFVDQCVFRVGSGEAPKTLRGRSGFGRRNSPLMAPRQRVGPGTARQKSRLSNVPYRPPSVRRSRVRACWVSSSLFSSLATLSQACMTVVWSRPPKTSPMRVVDS